MPEHELEQIKGALAQVQFEEIGLNIREAMELADRFYGGEIAASPQSGDGVELADTDFSLHDGFSSSNLYGSGRF